MLLRWLKILTKKSKPTRTQQWRSGRSIYQILSDNINSEGKLMESAQELPDENRDPEQLRFAPGLTDALLGTEKTVLSKTQIKHILSLLKRVALSGDRDSEDRVFEWILESQSIVGQIDEILKAVEKHAFPKRPYLFSFAHDMATKSNCRSSVKFGIAILGICQNRTILTELKTLGLHDEFTLYSAVAIINLSDDPVRDLWDLAKKVDGWGKIQIVERLGNMSLGAEVKNWMILEGYKNNILYEYLAFRCAVSGELEKELRASTIDLPLFKSTSDIIVALIQGGPAEDIYIYPHAATVVKDFIRHAAAHGTDVSDFIVLQRIKDFLIGMKISDRGFFENGWTENIISDCLIDLTKIIESKTWVKETLSGLESENKVIYWNAKQAAEKLGIDVWSTVWKRLRVQPQDYSSWYDVALYGRPQHIDEIVDFAITNLGLGESPSGPKDSLGLGPNYASFTCLVAVLTYLKNYPRKGESLVIAGLTAPVTRTRNSAIQLLGQWQMENWSPKIIETINNLKETEPNDHIKKAIMKLLEGDRME